MTIKQREHGLHHGCIGCMVRCNSQVWPESGETLNCPQVFVCMYLLIVFIMIFIFFACNPGGLSVKPEINLVLPYHLL